MKFITLLYRLYLEVTFFYFKFYYFIISKFSKTLIIQVKYGGLGDHLFFSHLPRLAIQSGKYNKVLISNYSEFRNDEIKKLVWEINPYVSGFISKKGFIYRGNLFKSKFYLLDQIAYFYGLKYTDNFSEPEIYYTPKKLNFLKGKSLFDPNYISNAGDINSVHLLKYFKNNNISIDYQLSPRNKSILISCNNFIYSENIFKFCDYLYSAKDVYCLVTGTATLLAALKKPGHIFYSDKVGKIFLHSKINNYIKINNYE